MFEARVLCWCVNETNHALATLNCSEGELPCSNYSIRNIRGF